MKKWIRNSLVVVGILGVASAAPLILDDVLAQTDLTLCVTAPGAVASRMEDALSYTYGYTDTVPTGSGSDTIPNPVSKETFANQVLIDFAINVTRAYEVNVASDIARDTAIQKAKDEIRLQ